MLHLLVVVDIADAAEYQREQVHIQVLEAALQHAPPPAGDDGHADTDNEHQSAHGGSALLGHVPLGADLLDALARLQTDEGGNEKLAHHGGDNKADDGSQNNFHVNDSLSFAP